MDPSTHRNPVRLTTRATLPQNPQHTKPYELRTACAAGQGATQVARPLKTTRKSCLCANATPVLALVPKSAGLILNLSGGGKYGDHQRSCVTSTDRSPMPISHRTEKS